MLDSLQLSAHVTCFCVNIVRVAACSHRRGARLRQVAHEALVLPQRRDSARQVRARAPRPLCLHLPRSAVVPQLAAARVPRLVPRTRVYNTSLVRLEQ